MSSLAKADVLVNPSSPSKSSTGASSLPHALSRFRNVEPCTRRAGVKHRVHTPLVVEPGRPTSLLPVIPRRRHPVSMLFSQQNARQPSVLCVQSDVLTGVSFSLGSRWPQTGVAMAIFIFWTRFITRLVSRRNESSCQHPILSSNPHLWL